MGDHVVSEHKTVPQNIIAMLTATANPTATGTFLTFSDPDSLTGVVAREDDTFFGPIDVSEGNGFNFAVQHREIYVRKTL